MSHARIQEFFSGGSRPDDQKTVWTTLFLVLNLFYSLQKGSIGFITEKTILFQGSRGGPTLSREGGGVVFDISSEMILRPRGETRA